MALTEESVIDLIQVLEDGQIQVRTANRVLRDGEEIAKTYHRHVIAPGDDHSAQHPRVSAVAQALWTPDVITKFNEKKAKNVGPK